MKPSFPIRCFALCAPLLLTLGARAADGYWDGTDTTGDADGGSGTWTTDVSTLNWDTAASGGGTAFFTALDNVWFGAAAGTVTTAGAFNAGTVTFGTAGYTIDTGANAMTWATLAGTGGFTKAGSATLTLTNASGASGNITVNAGRLTLGNNAALGTAAITLNGGTLERNAANVTVANAIAIGTGGGTLLGRQVVDDYTLFSGQLTGTGALTVQGLVRLNNPANTYAGALTISSASATYLRLSASEVLGNATTVSLAGANARLRLDGGVTETIAALSGSGEIFVSNNPGVGAVGTLKFGGNHASTSYTGSLSNNDGQLVLVKQGTGTFTLAPANSAYQGLTVSNGTVLATNANGGAGPTVTLGDADTGTNNIAFLTNGSGVSRAITVANQGSGSVTLGSSGGTSNVSFGGTITLNRATTLTAASPDRTTWTGKITGNVGTLTVAGGKRTVFESANGLNDFTGDVTITGTGTVLQIGASTLTGENIPNASSVTVETETFLKLASGSNSTETINALNGAGIVRRHEGVVGLQTLVLGAANGSGTFTGALENGGGTLALVKTGTGTQTLSGNSPFSGGTTVRQGTILQRHAGALGTGTVTLGDAGTGSNNPTVLLDVNGAAANLSTTANFTVAPITGGTAVIGSTASTPVGARQASFSGTITLNDDVQLRTGAGDFTTFSGNLTGTGNVAIANGSLTGDTRGNGGNRIIWSGTAKTFAGSLTLLSGTATNYTVLQINSNEMIPNATDVTLQNHTVLRLYSNESIDELSGTGRVRGVVSNYTLTAGANGGSSTFAGTMENDPYDGGSLSLAKTGGGSLTLTGASTYTGATAVNAGTLLVNGALGNTTVTVADNASLGGTGTIGGNVSFSGGSLLHIENPADALTINGSVTFGSGFGIDNILGLNWDTLALDTPYTLIAGTTTTFDASKIENFGLANKAPVGTADRYAYFETGSLRVVVVPEPAIVLLGSLGLFRLLRRRRG